MLSDELHERCLKVSPGGVHSPVRAFKSVGGTPVFFKSGKGAHLISVEGEQYTDFCQSFGPLILGHRDEEVQAEVERMINTIWSSGACEGYSLELAEWICEHIPVVEKLRFVSSGTEAVMSALRVARGATKKDKVLKFEGCYHGHVDSLLVKSGSGLAGKSSASSAGVPKATAEQTLVCPLDNLEIYLETLEQHKGDLAAVILEPLPANFGLLEQREEFIKAVTEEAQKKGVLVIFDEVISGFRIGLGGMTAKLNLKPDLVTYGKVIGGGFPVGCYGGKKDYMDLVAPLGPVYQAGTLSAHPIGMVAGLATLKKAKREDVWSQFKKLNSKFKSDFNSWAGIVGVPTRLHTTGSLFWFADLEGPVRSIDVIPKNHGDKFKYFFNSLLEQKVYLAPNGFEVGFLGNGHSQEIMEESLEKFKKAVLFTHENFKG